MAYDHTKYNYQEIIQRIAKIISDNSSNPAVWKDTNYSSTSQVILQLIAAIVDDLEYMLERRTQESYLPTARLLSSIGAIANGMGYRPRRRVSSRGTIQMNLNTPVVGGAQIKIPAYTPMTYASKNLVIIDEVVINQGVDQVDFTVAEGIVEHIQIDTTNGNIITNTGTREITYDTNTQTMLIDKYGDIENTAIIIKTIDSGGNTIDQYFDVSYKNPVTGEAAKGALSLCDANDAAYDVRMTNDGLTIVFGDGTFGKKPTNTIDIKWIRSSGASVTIPKTSTDAAHVYNDTFTTISDIETQLNTGSIDGVAVFEGMRILCNGLTNNKAIYTVIMNGSNWNLNPIFETPEANIFVYIKYGSQTNQMYYYDKNNAIWVSGVPSLTFEIPSLPSLQDNVLPVPNTYDYNITNTSSIAGGLEPESVDDIRRHAPDYVKTNNRAVTKHDFEYWTKASGIGGIVDAKAYGEEEIGINPLGWTANNVYVTYLKKDKTALTHTELQALKSWLDEYKQVTSIVVIQQAINVPLALDIVYTPNNNLNISTNQTIEYIKTALHELFAAKEGALGKDIDHSEIVQHLHNYEVADQGGIMKRLVDNVTVKARAIKEYDFSSLTSIIDNIPVYVLKMENPPIDHIYKTSVHFKEIGTEAEIASPETCIVRFNPVIKLNTNNTGLDSTTTYQTVLDINGTQHTLSINGANAQSFSDLESELQTAIDAVATGIKVKVNRHIFVYGDGSQTSITFNESSVTNKLFASCDGYNDIVNTGARTEMKDVGIDSDTAFVGVGMLNYKTGELLLINDTWLPDNVYVSYLQDERMNFKAGPTQVLDFDENMSTFTNV